ncbi:MAG: zinc ribbon domain-containing protein [Gemmatimonadaceae bacterium]
MMALAVGTALALIALAFVLHPLFTSRRSAVLPRLEPEKLPAAELAIAGLREVEFDRATGKLSDEDYADLKSAFTRDAVAALRADAPQGLPDAPRDAAVLEYRQRRRECPACGPRPEPAAQYCSSCGTYLAGSCGSCGAKVTDTGARYCAACGRSLAA